MTAKTPEETRQRILEACAEEMHHQGFQGTGINAIVERAGITKGALFHHFKGKLELGYAYVDEVIRPHLEEVWVEPLSAAYNPIDTILHILYSHAEEARKNEELVCDGCPLNNLAQEMSPIDEGFRQRLNDCYDHWRSAVEQALNRGIENGTVGSSVNTHASAAFIVSSIAGLAGTLKASRSLDLAMACMNGLSDYLNSLRG